MNKQDLITKIQTSSIIDLRKDQVLALINENELTPDIIDQIKDIIQDDIDESVTDILSDDQIKEITDIDNQGKEEISVIAAEVTSDVNFVEKEMENLETTLNTLAPAIDEMEIDTVKNNLNNATK